MVSVLKKRPGHSMDICEMLMTFEDCSLIVTQMATSTRSAGLNVGGGRSSSPKLSSTSNSMTMAVEL